MFDQTFTIVDCVITIETNCGIVTVWMPCNVAYLLLHLQHNNNIILNAHTNFTPLTNIPGLLSVPPRGQLKVVYYPKQEWSTLVPSIRDLA